jgi:tetratricopeptide (TPR) repeat protein
MFNLALKLPFAGAALACLLLGSACSTTNRSLTKLASLESRKSLAAGDFEKALSVLHEAAKKNPSDTEHTTNYVRTVEEIKKAADRARGQREYARAGGIYRLLSDNYSDFRAFTTKLTFTKARLETALKECRIAAVDNPAALAVKAGDFARAIDLFHAAFKANPVDVELAAKYRATVDEIKAIANDAFGADDFSRAGIMNVLLLKNLAAFEGLKPPVAFNRELLEVAVGACRESLTKTGLTEYRKGNLAKAIAVWESLLSFDPDNEEIKKAVNTAKTQLAGIKKFAFL